MQSSKINVQHNRWSCCSRPSIFMILLKTRKQKQIPFKNFNIETPKTKLKPIMNHHWLFQLRIFPLATMLIYINFPRFFYSFASDVKAPISTYFVCVFEKRALTKTTDHCFSAEFNPSKRKFKANNTTARVCQYC